MTVENPPVFLDGGTYGAEVCRRATTALIPRGSTIGSVIGGLIGSGDMAVTPGSGMQVLVAPGEVYIPGTSAATQGGYYDRVASSTALSVAAANVTNPRIDLVVAQVEDSAYSGASNLFQVVMLTGTATSGATLSNLSGAPSLTASSLALAYVLVPANASSISGGNIKPVAPSVPPSGLFPKGITSSTTTSSGQLLEVTGTSAVTVTLPAHSKGQRVAVSNFSSAVTTVAGSDIYGPGVAAGSSIPLGPSANVTLLDDGASWLIVAGALDSGWVALTPGTNITSSASIRQLGDRVWLKGYLESTGSVAGETVIATWSTSNVSTPPGLGAAAMPASTSQGSGEPNDVYFGSKALYLDIGVTGGVFIYLEGLSASLS
jgi:hypothetical protein